MMKILVNLLFVVVSVGLLYQFVTDNQANIDLDAKPRLEEEVCVPVSRVPIRPNDSTAISYARLLSKITKDINLLLKKAARDIKQQEHSTAQASPSTADASCVK